MLTLIEPLLALVAVLVLLALAHVEESAPCVDPCGEVQFRTTGGRRSRPPFFRRAGPRHVGHRAVIVRLPDDTWFYPGHGGDGVLGHERAHLEEWRERGW